MCSCEVVVFLQAVGILREEQQPPSLQALVAMVAGALVTL